MKVVILALSVFLGGAVFAQETAKREGFSNEDRAKQRTERLAQKLSLNDEQKEKLTAAHLDAIKKKEEVKNTALTEDQRNEEYKKIHEGVEAKYKEVLTSEQYEKYTAEKSNFKAKMHHPEKKFTRNGTPMEKKQEPAELNKK